MQADKRSIDFSECGRPDQVLENHFPLFSGSVTFFEAIRRRARPVTPSVKTLEALGAKNTQDNRTDPHVTEIPSTPLEAPPGNGRRTSFPSGKTPKVDRW